jgi:hypothetical protein
MTHTTTLPTAAAWRLQALLRARVGQPFAWGVRDCAMLAFDAALAATGQDPAPDLRGAYASAPQAFRLLRTLGGLRGMAAARFGAPVAVADAGDGDVLLLSADVCTSSKVFGGALGIRWQGLCIGQGATGLVQVPIDSVQACWKVS